MFIILSGILYVLGCTIIFKEIKDYVIRNIAALMFLASLFLLWTEYGTKPSAMDVYQGKTTLEKVYRNNIPIDSTVIYKPGKY